MKVKQIEVEFGIGAVIADAPYENTKPYFSQKYIVDLTDKDKPEEVTEKFRGIAKQEIMEELDLLKNRLKAERIETQYEEIRFREKDGKKYPSVTSITSISEDFHIGQDELEQYGARGTIVHHIIEHYRKTGKWIEINELLSLEVLKYDIITLMSGSLKLKIEDCSYKAFFAKYEKEYKYIDSEVELFNENHVYCGKTDEFCLNAKNELGIWDYKTGTIYNLKQPAAYIKCKIPEEILKKYGQPKWIGIAPVGRTKNKSGYMKPIISRDIDKEFEEFLKDRRLFKRRFGI